MEKAAEVCFVITGGGEVGLVMSRDISNFLCNSIRQ